MDDTRSNYYDSVESIGQSVRERVKAGEDEGDAVREEVDGSHWIIYTSSALAVLQHSSNDDAIFDHMGSDALSGVKSMSEVYTSAAFFAMYQDVVDWLYENPAEDEEGEEEEDEGPAE